MAKINIPFKGKDYPIDQSLLAPATAELQSHLSTEMSGSGAVINLDGNSYNVDSEKLTTSRNDFVSHLGTISGTGSTIVVNGVGYSVDSTKLDTATTELTTTFGRLSSGGEPVVMRAAGLYETGTDNMTASWDELIADGTVHVDNGVVYTNLDFDEWSNASSDALTGDLVLPNDGTITSIGDAAYDEDDNFTGRHGFCLCENLTSVTIPDSVQTISDEAFYGCYGLINITIPNGVTSIGSWAFCECYGLTNITIPDGVTSIGSWAFCVCHALMQVIISGTVTKIGIAAFENTLVCCIADSQPSGWAAGLDEEWQRNCPVAWGFKGITTTNAEYDYIANDKDNTAILYAYKGTNSEIVIPSTIDGYDVTSVGWAYKSNSIITSVTLLEDGPVFIPRHAFINCENLTDIVMPANVDLKDATPYDIFENCPIDTVTGTVGMIGSFGGFDVKTAIMIGGEFSGWWNLNNLKSLEKVVLGSAITSIGDNAFSNCSKLASITIPDSVTFIGKEAFYGCSSLTEIVIPNSVTEIGDGAFIACSGLTELIIPDGVSAIEAHLIQRCSNLTSIRIPASVTHIGNSAIYDCTSLTDVYYTGTQEQWSIIEIEGGNSTLERVTIHYNYQG